jgi:hypothetical protein
MSLVRFMLVHKVILIKVFCETDDRMVSQLLASFEGSALSLPDFTNPGFTPYKCLDPSTHRRYWTGSFTCDETEEEAKEPWREATVETEQLPMLRTINVGLRTFELKCRLVNEDEEQDSC